MESFWGVRGGHLNDFVRGSNLAGEARMQTKKESVPYSPERCRGLVACIKSPSVVSANRWNTGFKLFGLEKSKAPKDLKDLNPP